MARAAIKNAESAKRHPLDDAAVMDVLSQQAKRYRESIAEFSKANRPDMKDRDDNRCSSIYRAV
ncbi:MAG: hypothetical protein DDT26_01698 [Dehalococcoidia bacterium]|nr:hypothetical protein [Chloroflexota bacterium]MBT9166314.1 hypothetical protein [Chloroflexota bacterium]